jgi:hypothetical protein
MTRVHSIIKVHVKQSKKWKISMASKKSTTHVKILGSLTQHITNGAWHAQPYIPDRILCTLQRTQMGMGSWTQSGCM